MKVVTIDLYCSNYIVYVHFANKTFPESGFIFTFDIAGHNAERPLKARVMKKRQNVYLMTSLFPQGARVRTNTSDKLDRCYVEGHFGCYATSSWPLWSSL